MSTAPEKDTVSSTHSAPQGAPKKPERTTPVYVYLAVLFAAAFAMLLLAYFVQLRNSETAMDDLRSTMNRSRDDLLAEIRDLEDQNTALEEKNTALHEELDRWKDDLVQLREHYEEKSQEATDLWNQNYDAQEELYSWASFWALEQYYQAGDYERCAVLLLMQGQSQFQYRTPDSAQERQAEIVQAVIDAGILDEDYYRYPDKYNELLNAYITDIKYGITGSDAAETTDVSRETER